MKNIWNIWNIEGESRIEGLDFLNKSNSAILRKFKSLEISFPYSRRRNFSQEKYVTRDEWELKIYRILVIYITLNAGWNSIVKHKWNVNIFIKIIFHGWFIKIIFHNDYFSLEIIIRFHIDWNITWNLFDFTNIWKMYFNYAFFMINLK